MDNFSSAISLLIKDEAAGRAAQYNLVSSVYAKEGPDPDANPSVPNQNRTDHVLQDRTVYVLLTLEKAVA